MPKIIDNLYAARLAALIYLDWKRWEAYKLGLIGDNGVILKQPTTPKEKAAYTYFHRFASTLKQLVETVPGGKTKIGKLIALYAMVRESGHTDEDIFENFDLENWLVESESIRDEFVLFPEFKDYVNLWHDMTHGLD